MLLFRSSTFSGLLEFGVGFLFMLRSITLSQGYLSLSSLPSSSSLSGMLKEVGVWPLSVS